MYTHVLTITIVYWNLNYSRQTVEITRLQDNISAIDLLIEYFKCVIIILSKFTDHLKIILYIQMSLTEKTQHFLVESSHTSTYFGIWHNDLKYQNIGRTEPVIRRTIVEVKQWFTQILNNTNSKKINNNRRLSCSCPLLALVVLPMLKPRW